jgi:hypothetical protein
MRPETLGPENIRNIATLFARGLGLTVRPDP